MTADARKIEERSPVEKRSRRIELQRAHRDLLVFRQPADPVASAAAARECAKAVAA